MGFLLWKRYNPKTQKFKTSKLCLRLSNNPEETFSH